MADYTISNLYPLRLDHVRRCLQMSSNGDRHAFLQAAYGLQTGLKPPEDLVPEAAALVRDLEESYRRDDRPCGMFVIGSDASLAYRCGPETEKMIRELENENPHELREVWRRFEEFLACDIPLAAEGLSEDSAELLTLLRKAAQDA